MKNQTQTKPKKDIVINMRLSKEQYDLIKFFTDEKKMKISEFLREASHNFMLQSVQTDTLIRLHFNTIEKHLEEK